MRGRERERERKGEREGFYVAALWMHAIHPRTLAANLAGFARFGCLKDLPEILHRIIHGGASTRTPGKQARLAAEGRLIARLRLRMSRGTPATRTTASSMT